MKNWLLDIGNGRGEKLNGRCVKLNIPKNVTSSSLDDMIDFCFHPDLFEDPLNNAKLINGTFKIVF